MNLYLVAYLVTGVACGLTAVANKPKPALGFWGNTSAVLVALFLFMLVWPAIVLINFLEWLVEA